MCGGGRGKRDPSSDREQRRNQRYGAGRVGGGRRLARVRARVDGGRAFDLAKGDAYSGKKVMAWGSGSRPAGVFFTRAGSGYYGVTAQDDGVYVIPNGIMVIVR